MGTGKDADGCHPRLPHLTEELVRLGELAGLVGQHRPAPPQALVRHDRFRKHRVTRLRGNIVLGDVPHQSPIDACAIHLRQQQLCAANGCQRPLGRQPEVCITVKELHHSPLIIVQRPDISTDQVRRDAGAIDT